MNVLFTDVMTVYNYHKADGEIPEDWQRHVIRGVQWVHGQRRLTVVKGVQTEERVEEITVDFGRRYDRPAYVEPVAYRKTGPEERTVCWTLDAASGLDFLVLGEAVDEITCEADIDRLREAYQYVTVVTDVADCRNRPRLKHIGVVAK